METLEVILENDRDRYVEGIHNDVLIIFFVVSNTLVFALVACCCLRRRLNAVYPVGDFEMYEFREVYDRVNPQQGEDDRVRRLIDGAENADDSNCPICLERSTNPTITDCGHIFCCVCVSRYWKHTSSPFERLACAVCRAEVKMLIPMWSEPPANTNRRELKSMGQAMRLINEYNRRFAVNRTAWSYVRDLPVLVGYILHQDPTDALVLEVFKARTVFTLFCLCFYVFCPYQLFSGSKYAGVMDGMFIVLVVLGYISMVMLSFISRRDRVAAIE